MCLKCLQAAMNATRACILFACVSLIGCQTLWNIFSEQFVQMDYQCSSTTQIVFNLSGIYPTLRCIVDCVEKNSCLSVSYNLETLSCVGCESPVNVEEIVDISTLLVFQKQDGQTSTPAQPTTTTTPTATTTLPPIFSCPADDAIFRTVLLSDGTHFTYKVVKVNVSQSDAIAGCSAQGGFLTRVKTVAKMDMLLNLVRNCAGYSGSEYYTDGSNANAADYFATGAWTFLDGDPVPMSSDFWGLSFPNSPSIQHCLRMQMSSANYKFDDCSCDSLYYYICEK